MVQWKIGCSGYHYADWKGIFYPDNIPKKEWFEFYCRHFNSVELNGTFYKFPRVENLKSWHARSPGNFTFSVKAPRFITHFRKFKDAQRMLGQFYDISREGLEEKLGCVLFQFPANFSYEPEHLERIIEMLDRSFVNVVEFRHASWWTAEVYSRFSENEIVFCGMSHPTLPETLVRTSPVVYYRFHGVPLLYYSPYDQKKLEEVAAQATSDDYQKQVYLFFNNTAEGAAVNNAKQMLEISEMVAR